MKCFKYLIASLIWLCPAALIGESTMTLRDRTIDADFCVYGKIEMSDDDKKAIIFLPNNTRNKEYVYIYGSLLLEGLIPQFSHSSEARNEKGESVMPAKLKIIVDANLLPKIDTSKNALWILRYNDVLGAYHAIFVDPKLQTDAQEFYDHFESYSE